MDQLQQNMQPLKRKGASRIADIPPEVLRALEAGTIETVTLVEWLAIDVRKLARSVVRASDWGEATQPFLVAVDAAALLSAGKRHRAIGSALHIAMKHVPAAGSACASHRSDMVRAWAAFAYALGENDSFAKRLGRLKSFAADSSMATKEAAWDAWRPFFAMDPAAGIPALLPWVRDKDPNVRRCAIEGTRPRGVWTPHIKAMVQDPDLGLPLLEIVRADPARYVQLAVGNWLNDAGKSQPQWLRRLARRWEQESPIPATAFILKRGLRSLS